MYSIQTQYKCPLLWLEIENAQFNKKWGKWAKVDKWYNNIGI